MKKLILISAAVMLAFSLMSCDPQAGGECEHEWERVENYDQNTAVDKCELCDETRMYTDPDLSPETDKGTSPETDPVSEPETEPVSEPESETEGSEDTLPDMNIPEGFSVAAFDTQTLKVTEKGALTDRAARVAVLGKENGESALYIDVIDGEGEIITDAVFKGACQLFMNNKGELILFRFSKSSTRPSAMASYTMYTVSDQKLSGYDVVNLEKPEINAVPCEGASVEIPLDGMAQSGYYDAMFENMIFGFRDALAGADGDGEGICLIADSYFDPASPVVYQYEEGVAVPNFEDESVRRKYTLDHALALGK